MTGSCTPTTSVCYSQFLDDEVSAGQDYGDVSSLALAPFVENAEYAYVNLTYTSAAPCPEVPSEKVQTRLRLVCDYETLFEFLEVTPGRSLQHTTTCSVEAHAATVHACPLNHDLCRYTVKNRHGNSATYELQSLAADRSTIHEAYGAPNTSFADSSVEFNICAPVLLPYEDSGPCTEDTGACLVSAIQGEAPPVDGPPDGVGKLEFQYARLGLQTSVEFREHPSGLDQGIVLEYSGARRATGHSRTAWRCSLTASRTVTRRSCVCGQTRTGASLCRVRRAIFLW